MRRIVSFSLIAVILFTLLVVYRKEVTSRRESRYREALALEGYKSELPIGTSREKVKEYFESHRIRYQALTETSRLRPAGSFAIGLGSTNVNMFCDWSAYIVFEFSTENPPATKASPFDPLVNIKVIDAPQNCL